MSAKLGGEVRSSGEEERVGELIVVRHGETEWSRAGRHTGRTDVPLTPAGEAQARALAPLFQQRRVARLLVSPASRAHRTAELAGMCSGLAEPDLWEWDYGGYEGRTTAEIRQEQPDWLLWSDGVVPGDDAHPGESLTQVGERVDAVLARVRPWLADGDVALVAHGHVLRVLTARWLGLPPSAGGLFQLDPATVSVLSTEHGRPVLARWNSLPPVDQDR